jgi:hypothetical protein
LTTEAELRSLLGDCLVLWEVEGRVIATEEGLVVAGRCVVQAGGAPTRWFVTVDGRTRPVPSVVALLSAVRRALGVAPGVRARVGIGAAAA